MSKLDDFYASEDFVRMCCTRWREFKKTLTPEDESRMAADVARVMAETIEGRGVVRRGVVRRGKARRGEAGRGKAETYQTYQNSDARRLRGD